ncbi:MAG: hypothetical protein GXO82_05900 [Chlorobi bacterium]|nr:hypothetical protein [Chlorobiota bacterium]
MTAPERLPRTSKIFLTLLVFSGILWFGGIVYRALIANEFFVANTLDYLPDISPDKERVLFQLLASSSTIIVISYFVFLASVIGIVKSMKIRLKDNGWLMAALILFFMFVPVEIFTAYLDVDFILDWRSAMSVIHEKGLQEYTRYSGDLRKTLAHRIGALGGLPVIALLSYFSALVLVIWKPLRKTESVETRETQ